MRVLPKLFDEFHWSRNFTIFPSLRVTGQNLKKLADLKPKTLAIMHGSSFTGDCAQALSDLNVMLQEVFGPRK